MIRSVVNIKRTAVVVALVAGRAGELPLRNWVTHVAVKILVIVLMIPLPLSPQPKTREHPLQKHA